MEIKRSVRIEQGGEGKGEEGAGRQKTLKSMIVCLCE
jgi:hypothetical protein